MQATEEAEPTRYDDDLWRAPVREPLLADEISPRARRAMRVSFSAMALLAIAFLGYQAFGAKSPDDRLAWTPPAGLHAEETPPWLQTLCADATPELCAAADRARTASDCDAMRGALRALEGVERKLTARGTVSLRQHLVLVELYGQGNELCEFQRSQAEPGPK